MPWCASRGRSWKHSAGCLSIDWEIATGDGLDSLAATHDVRPVPEQGPVPVQVIPSGPIPQPLAILQMILGALYAAQRELIITTPYFVPDESLLTALRSAAQRGVEVTLVLPAKNDSRLVDLAGKAVFADLLGAGVHIAAFKGGLLHTKSITVDGEFALFGSVNMDMRSLWLNFELSLLIYDRETTLLIRRMQRGYLEGFRSGQPGRVASAILYTAICRECGSFAGAAAVVRMPAAIGA